MGSELAINSGAQKSYISQAENDNSNIVISGCRKIKKAIESVLNCFINAVRFVIELFIPKTAKEDRDIVADTQTHPKLTETKTEEVFQTQSELPNVEIKEAPQLANIEGSETDVASVNLFNSSAMSAMGAMGYIPWNVLKSGSLEAHLVPEVEIVYLSDESESELESEIENSTVNDEILVKSNIDEISKILSPLDVFLTAETDKIPPLVIKPENIEYCQSNLNSKGVNKKVGLGKGAFCRSYLAEHQPEQQTNNKQLLAVIEAVELKQKLKDNQVGIIDKTNKKMQRRHQKEILLHNDVSLIIGEKFESRIAMPFRGISLDALANGGKKYDKLTKLTNKDIRNNISLLAKIENPDITPQAGTLSEKVVFHIMRQIFEEVVSLNENNRSHGDIAIGNVCIDGNTKISLIDAGSIIKYKKLTDSRATNRAHNRYYMAPELVKSGRFYMSSDIWSIGVLAYQLLAGRADICNMAAGGCIPYQKDGAVNVRMEVSDKMKDILTKLLTLDPEKRPTAKQALKLLGPRPEIEQMNLLDLTLTKSKFEPIIANLQSLATNADRRKQEHTTMEDVTERLDFAEQQLNQVCKQIDYRKNLSS
jgi:serine/threonine protein kinase/transcriptional regulator with XRE-family HTH domain